MDAKLTDARAERGLALARSSRIKQIVSGTFLVPSASHNHGGYVVDSEKGSCTCPDHELRGEILKCKHRWAVEFARHQVTAADGTTSVVNTMRVSYTQDWASYNAAQTTEKSHVQVLLKALCDGVHNPPQLGRGRRRLALADVIFAAVMKTFVGMSGRRATSDIVSCREKGLIDKVPAFNTIFEHMESEEITPILRRLVRIYAVPLAQVETKFAIDGTGFTTAVYNRYYDTKYGRNKKEAEWIKLHAICGVTTNIITAVEVTDSTLHDSPLLPQLVRETAESFTMAEVSADKGYLGTANLTAIEGVGAKPFIAFKTNSQPRGPDVWKRAFHMFAFHREEWLQRYHVRSNIESTFSAVKRKFGGSVRSRRPTSMANEVLLKCLANNLSCLVHAMHELGIEAKFWTKSTP